MKKFLPFILLFLSVVPLIDLFHPGLPITHDGQDHVARIANFYGSLSEGVIVPRWAENLNWGYGHPILMFLYPLPSYITSVFHAVGFNFVDSLKITFAASFILSGLAMYLWLQSFLPATAAFLGGMLYMYAPYRFVDLYVRGAIGEHVAFIFPPLILYFLLKLSKKNNYLNFAGAALSLAGLILAHNAICLMFLPVILLYAGYLIMNSKKKKYLMLATIFFLLVGFGLSAFFWVPAFGEGKYTLRDIVVQGSVFKNFVDPRALLYGPWSYGISGQFSVQVGIVQWLSVLASIPLLFKRKKDHNWILVLSGLVLFLATLFIMTSYSQLVWQKITTLQKFQFPWRFLSLSVFLTAFLSALVFSKIPKKYEKAALIILVSATLLFAKDQWKAKGYLQRPEVFYSGVYKGTTDTGESAPIWSVRFMERFPKAHLEVIGGKGEITERERSSTFHSYIVRTNSDIQLRENTLYFPGWKVFIDGKEANVEFQDMNSRGIITFRVPRGEHEVALKFGETKLRMFADAISLGSLVMLLVLGIIKLRKRD